MLSISFSTGAEMPNLLAIPFRHRASWIAFQSLPLSNPRELGAVFPPAIVLGVLSAHARRRLFLGIVPVWPPRQSPDPNTASLLQRSVSARRCTVLMLIASPDSRSMMCSSARSRGSLALGAWLLQRLAPHHLLAEVEDVAVPRPTNEAAPWSLAVVTQIGTS